MEPFSQGIYNYILLTLDVKNIKIIVIKELHAPSLPSIKVQLCEYVLQALMVRMKLRSMT